MQLLKQPFYYNSSQLQNLSYNKILNDKYYAKFIFCSENRLNLGSITKLFKKIKILKTKKKANRKKKKKLKLKLKVELFLTEIYLDTFRFVEYFEDDFFTKNKVISSLGFSYKFKEKYFSNSKILNHDFLEKYFKFNSCSNYVKQYYKNLKIISLTNKYKMLIPLQPKKGGFLVFGFGFLGFLKKQAMQNISNQQLFSLLSNSFYNLPTFAFFFSTLKIKFKIKGRKHLKLRKRLKFYFSKI